MTAILLKCPSKMVIASCSILFVTGCAQLTHLTRPKTLAGKDSAPKAVFIDAKQRAVFSAAPVGDDKHHLLCAEPSPDALSALAASQGFSLTNSASEQLSQSLSLSEGAGSLGLRTQSIQLMRDTMYRLCEGYMNGTINKPAWQTFHRRLQSSMVAILAIEQLTGAVRAPAVQIGGSAVIGSAELVGKYTEKTEESRAKLREAESDLEKKEKEFAAAEEAVTNKTAERDTAKKAHDEETDTTKKAAKKTALDTKQSELEAATKDKSEKQQAREDAKKSSQAAKDALDAYDKARIAATTGSSSSATSVNHQALPAVQQLDATAIKEVGKNVSNIVESTLKLNFSREVCVTVFTTIDWSKKIEKGSLANRCLLYLDETINFVKAKNKTATAGALQIEAGNITTPEQLKAFKELLEQFGADDGNQLFSYNPATPDPAGTNGTK